MLILLLIYVDDVILTGYNSSVIQSIISTLSTNLALKDLGTLRYFLGIEIKYFENGVFLSQIKYRQDLLSKEKVLDCNPVATPMAIKITTNLEDSELVNVTEYRGLVGSLQYLTFTRPDITYVVNKVWQRFNDPTKVDLKKVKRILLYLKGSLNYGIHFLSQISLTLYSFSDSDWAGCPETRRSTTGYCVYLRVNCISWSSKKQTTVARSSAKAEDRSMATTAAEITWIQFLLHEIGLTMNKKTLLLCDNMSALYMTKNPVFHARTKHIELDFHFIREKVVQGPIFTRHVPSSRQITDVFIKPLIKYQFQNCRNKLGVHPIDIPNLRGADKIPSLMPKDQPINYKSYLQSAKSSHQTVTRSHNLIILIEGS